MIESNFICTLAMSAEDWFDFYCNTKLSESSDMTKHWVIHYYSVLQISFIQKCCGNYVIKAFVYSLSITQKKFSAYKKGVRIL